MWWHPGAGRACYLLSVGRETSLRFKFTAVTPEFLDCLLKHVCITLLYHDTYWRNRCTPPTLSSPSWCESVAVRSGPQHYAVYTGVLALSINVPQSGRHSNVQHSTAVMDLLLKPSCCVRFPANSNRDPSRSNTHSHAHRREEVSHNIKPISVKECGLSITK